MTEPREECRTCRKSYRRSELCEKRGGELCPTCLHAYELALFNPPDHNASDCALCLKATKEKAA